MADYDFPPDLIEAQRAFFAADAKVATIDAQYPRPTAIAAGEATIPDKLRQAHAEAWAERNRALDGLNGHEEWAKIPQTERFTARMALRKAARSAG